MCSARSKQYVRHKSTFSDTDFRYVSCKSRTGFFCGTIRTEHCSIPTHKVAYCDGSMIVDVFMCCKVAVEPSQYRYCLYKIAGVCLSVIAPTVAILNRIC